MRMRVGVLAGIVTIAMGAVVAARAPVGSAAAVQDLISEMTSKQLQAIAAADPDVPNRFVAAMLVPGVQLLVVGAETTAPAFIQQQITARQFSEAYSSLHPAAVPATKLFIQDMVANGLGADGEVDIMYEQGTRQTIFDDDPKR